MASPKINEKKATLMKNKDLIDIAQGKGNKKRDIGKAQKVLRARKIDWAVKEEAE